MFIKGNHWNSSWNYVVCEWNNMQWDLNTTVWDINTMVWDLNDMLYYCVCCKRSAWTDCKSFEKVIQIPHFNLTSVGRFLIPIDSKHCSYIPLVNTNENLIIVTSICLTVINNWNDQTSCLIVYYSVLCSLFSSHAKDNLYS